MLFPGGRNSVPDYYVYDESTRSGFLDTFSVGTHFLYVFATTFSDAAEFFHDRCSFNDHTCDLLSYNQQHRLGWVHDRVSAEIPHYNFVNEFTCFFFFCLQENNNLYLFWRVPHHISEEAIRSIITRPARDSSKVCCTKSYTKTCVVNDDIFHDSLTTPTCDFFFLNHSSSVGCSNDFTWTKLLVRSWTNTYLPDNPLTMWYSAIIDDDYMRIFHTSCAL